MCLFVKTTHDSCVVVTHSWGDIVKEDIDGRYILSWGDIAGEIVLLVCSPPKFNECLANGGGL